MLVVQSRTRLDELYRDLINCQSHDGPLHDIGIKLPIPAGIQLSNKM